MVEVRHLQAVLVLAEELNFTRAAERLHITQSALSKRIIEIEKHHGFHLFTRKNKRNVELSEVGRIFLEEARSALLHIDRAVQLGRAAREDSETILTVGHSPDADQAWVSAVLAIRLPLYPKLRIQLISEFSRELIRSVMADRFMVALAHLAFELALPTEESGKTALVAPEREETWVRRLFEKAVLGFAEVELEPLGWGVRGGVPLHWQVASASLGIPAILPRMVTDIFLDPPNGGRRVIVDTKFSSILGSRRFGGATLKSDYIYQMYAYVRSQEGIGLRSHETAGLFLHPAIDMTLFEQAAIQEHSITFATVNLSASPATIRSELRRILTS
jgi:5-methylcytosine-specific restriction enzyme subunit McrC